MRHSLYLYYTTPLYAVQRLPNSALVSHERGKTWRLLFMHNCQDCNCEFTEKREEELARHTASNSMCWVKSASPQVKWYYQRVTNMKRLTQDTSHGDRGINIPISSIHSYPRGRKGYRLAFLYIREFVCNTAIKTFPQKHPNTSYLPIHHRSFHIHAPTRTLRRTCEN